MRILQAQRWGMIGLLLLSIFLLLQQIQRLHALAEGEEAMRAQIAAIAVSCAPSLAVSEPNATSRSVRNVEMAPRDEVLQRIESSLGMLTEKVETLYTEWALAGRYLQPADNLSMPVYVPSGLAPVPMPPNPQTRHLRLNSAAHVSAQGMLRQASNDARERVMAETDPLNPDPLVVHTIMEETRKAVREQLLKILPSEEVDVLAPGLPALPRPPVEMGFGNFPQ